MLCMVLVSVGGHDWTVSYLVHKHALVQREPPFASRRLQMPDARCDLSLQAGDKEPLLAARNLN